MTEFRKFSAALDDAKLTLQTAAATDNSDSATAREAEAPSRTVQKPRYGATMRAKVAAARDRLEATLRTAAEVVDALDVDVAAEEASERAAADARIQEERSE